jgi:agmatinase
VHGGPPVGTAGAVLDPSARWGARGKPAYAGLVTFGGASYTEDAAELAGVDVAIVGAPSDERVSDHPGARLGPRAIRAASVGPGTRVGTGIDALAILRVVDFGDAPVVPADAEATDAAIEATVREVVAAGVLPVLLGGDHSTTHPAVRARRGDGPPLGLLQLDAHADTAPEVFGVELSHGTQMRRLVQEGHVDPERFAQLGLRGYWPGPDVFAWQRERGITTVPADALRATGLEAGLDAAVAAVGPGAAWLSVDVDVLDPAFAPGTGTPEPGGLTSAELLWLVRELATRCTLAGVDVVEVSPLQEGSHDPTALVASRVVRAALDGIARRRAAVSPATGRPA